MKERLVVASPPPRSHREACLVSDKFKCLAVESSGSFVRKLTDKFSDLVLHTLDYKMNWKDGSLLWSEVYKVTEQGVLLQPGLKTALLSNELKERRKIERMASGSGGLRTSDPLAQPKPQPSGRSGRGGMTLGRGRRGRGRQQRDETAGPDELHRNPRGQALDATPLPTLPAPPDASEEAGASGATSSMADILGEEYDIFGFEAELEDLLDEDVEELLATLADPQHGLDAGASEEAQVVGELNQNVEERANLLAIIEEEADACGLEGEPGEPLCTEGNIPSKGNDATAAASSSIDRLAAQSVECDPPPPPPPPERCTGPSPMGYVSFEGRSILRILRGNPKNSLSIKCYRHPGCTWLLPLRLAPPDADLIAWSFEVPPATPGMPPAEAKELARRHIKLAERWRPAPKS